MRAAHILERLPIVELLESLVMDAVGSVQDCHPAPALLKSHCIWEGL